MRIIFAVALVAIFGSSVLAQDGIVVEGAADAVGTANSVVSDSIVGTVVEGDVQSSAVTEPTSVVTGEVVQGGPVYTEMAPVEGGTVVSEGGAVFSEGTPMVATPSCGCSGGGSPAPMTYSSAPMEASPAPVMTYSSAPVQYSAPVSSPCCPQPRRGFFRTLFGN